jgi:Ca2+-binding EF-hand superfamily protein
MFWPSATLIRGIRDRMAAEGFPIPERFKEQLGRFDTDNDGKLSAKEVDAIPEGVRNRVRQAIRLQLVGDGE